MSILRRLGVLVIVVSLAGCGPDDPSGNVPNRPGVPDGAIKGCDVQLVEPTALPYAGGLGEPPVPPEHARIAGTAIATCDVVPVAHVMHVSVEEQIPGGLWAPVANAFGNIFSECSTLPGPGIPVRCEHIVPCFDGIYRTTVTVIYTDEFGPGSFTPSEERSARIVCPT